MSIALLYITIFHPTSVKTLYNSCVELFTTLAAENKLLKERETDDSMSSLFTATTIQVHMMLRLVLSRFFVFFE